MAVQNIDSINTGGLNQPPPGEADPPFLDLQDPAPLATGITIADNIEVRVNDTGDGVDQTSIIIRIDVGSGFVVAYDFGGGFQNGYAGTVNPSGNGFFFDINPDVDFPDLQVVSVRVTCTDLSPLQNPLDETYTFTTADETPPFITNQVPLPGAVNVLQNANIALRVDDLASPVVLASIQITVNQGGAGAVQAVVNGIVVSPFNGGGESVTPASNGFDIVLDPTTSLIELDTVVITVSADDDQGNQLINAQYMFTTGDQTAPAIVPVDPLASATVAPSTNIIFDILDLGTGVDLTTLLVEIDEGGGFVNAFTASAFVAPYDGVLSSTAVITNGFRITIDKDGELTPLQTISVRVTVDDLAGVPNTAMVTYTFDTTDSGTIDTPIFVANIGGGPFDLTGTIPVGTYLVFVGPAGDNTDPPVYNGDPGSGGTLVTFELIPGGAGKTRPTKDVFLPPLPIGGPYVFTFEPQPSGGTINSNATVTVLGENFPDRALAIRRVQPPWFAVGPRNIDSKGFPQS